MKANQEMTKNMAKYESYKFAFGQIARAIEKCFPVEAIALEESIISDRLQSAAEGKCIALKSVRKGRTAGFAELAELVKTDPKFANLATTLAGSGLSAESLIAWGKDRNDFIHNVVHGAPNGAPAISAASFKTMGLKIAANGLKLARIVCDWSKRELRECLRQQNIPPALIEFDSFSDCKLINNSTDLRAINPAG